MTEREGAALWWERNISDFGPIVIYTQTRISKVLEANLSKHAISLRLIDWLLHDLIYTSYKEKL